MSSTEPPRCPERNPDTGRQCARVFPPHEGYQHIDDSGAAWGEQS